jgi:hypothetical protein
VKVKVPLQNATLFETEAFKVQPKSVTGLERIAKKYGGSLA